MILESLAKDRFGTKVPPRGSMPEAERLVKIYSDLPPSTAIFWLFREPRGVAGERSRFKILCRHYGIPRRARRNAVGVLDRAPTFRLRTRRNGEGIAQPNNRGRVAAPQIAFDPEFAEPIPRAVAVPDWVGAQLLGGNAVQQVGWGQPAQQAQLGQAVDELARRAVAQQEERQPVVWFNGQMEMLRNNWGFNGGNNGNAQ